MKPQSSLKCVPRSPANYVIYKTELLPYGYITPQ